MLSDMAERSGNIKTKASVDSGSSTAILTEFLQGRYYFIDEETKVFGGYADKLTHAAGQWGRWDGTQMGQILEPMI